jgi:hypothetical protein
LQAGTKSTFYIAAIGEGGVVATDKEVVKIGATTARYTADRIRAVARGAELTSVKFTVTQPNKPADLSDFDTFTNKIVVSYTVTVNRVKTTYEATLIDGVLDSVRTNGNDITVVDHPFAKLSATVPKVGGTVSTIIVSGLPLAGTKYSFSVSTIASNGRGHSVESLAGRAAISTVKFPAPSSVRALGTSTTDVVDLMWSPYTAPNGVTVMDYQIYQLDASKNIVNVVSANDFSSQGGTFDMTGVTPIGSGNKFTFYLRAIADDVPSLGGKVVVKK